jgi:hypothetical protein
MALWQREGKDIVTLFGAQFAMAAGPIGTAFADKKQVLD